MTTDLDLVLFWFLSHLLGAVPFGLLVARAFGAGDIRTRGSGNIGATNVLRNAGKKAGILALLLDMLKGGVPAVLGVMLWPEQPNVAAGGGVLAAFLGHLFPIFLKFRGGKGVATGLGGFCGWEPILGLATIALWLFTAWRTRISSLSALIAFGLLPVIAILLGKWDAAMVAWVTGILIFWRHRENIRRLRMGTEPRIGNRG